MQAAKVARALVDVDAPDGRIFALALHEADAGAHDHDEEQVEDYDEGDASGEQDELDHHP